MQGIIFVPLNVTKLWQKEQSILKLHYFKKNIQFGFNKLLNMMT
jgi:hypothetical protein